MEKTVQLANLAFTDLLLGWSNPAAPAYFRSMPSSPVPLPGLVGRNGAINQSINSLLTLAGKGPAKTF